MNMGRFHLLTVVVASRQPATHAGLAERALRTIREHYADFGPTVRQLMTPTGLGNPQITAARTSISPASGLYHRAHPN